MKSATNNHKQSITEGISVCIKNNLSFAAYQLPNSKNRFLVVQNSPQSVILNDLSGIRRLKGFLISPFQASEKNPMVLIQPDHFFENSVDQQSLETLKSIVLPAASSMDTSQEEISKDDYIQQVDTIIEEIKNKRFEKAVLSRIKKISGDYSDKISHIFSVLCDEYPNAFVYVFRSGSQFWVGATPEPLADVNNGSFETASVAGTKPFCEKYLHFENWQKKELDEQNYVTRFISQVLKDFELENYKLTGPYIKQAGNLLHLRTDFSFETLNLNGSVGRLIENLHPTSAVCGMPKTETLKYITQVEKHNRQYYGGFLGPVGLANTIMLFVNLRCMRVFKHSLSLFIGGGITLDSNAAEEWEETEIKAETLSSVIKKIN